MKRLLILPATAVVCVAEIWRRGYVAPLLYGVRQLTAARRHPENYEADVMA